MALDPDTIGDEAVASVLSLLHDFRRQVIEALLSTPARFQEVHRQRLREIDGMIREFESGLRNAMSEPTRRAASAGDEDALERLVRANVDVPAVFMGVSPGLVQTAALYQAELITDLGNWARGQITKEIRRAALGNTPITELIQRIGTNLEDKSIFKTILDRAEAIARTEISRVYNQANFEQGEDIAARYEGVMKEWVHAGFGTHSRPNHVRLNGTVIPYEDEFDLGGGITAPHPHHWKLPAGEVVHCRCRIRTIMPEGA